MRLSSNRSAWVVATLFVGGCLLVVGAAEGLGAAKAKPPAAKSSKKKKKGGGGTFSTMRAEAPEVMRFVAARRLAIYPDRYIDAYVATEASFITAHANVGDDPSVEEFPAATTILMRTSELPFPVFLEKDDRTVELMIALSEGTPIAMFGKLIPQPRGHYALAVMKFDVPAGRVKPKTK